MDYKSTLNLPKTDFPMKANLPQREPAMLKWWQENNLYERLVEKRLSATKFILHDGPPYSNGDIHIGHVLNKTLKDIIIKYKSMRGYFAPFVPGWDCHGLPVEHQLFKELNISKSEINQVEFRRKAYNYAMKYVRIQREQFRRLGIFGDWDNPYLTLSKEYEAQIVNSFGNLVKAGYVYKGLKPVNWCRVCETALAEAEVEYTETVSPSIYVKFRLIPGEDKDILSGLSGRDIFVIIWTTTPWTLVSNVAVALHPSFEYACVEVDKEIWVLLKDLAPSLMQKFGIKSYGIKKSFRGSEVEGLHCLHPFLDRKSVIVLAEYVSAQEGTGCVHTAPGHGQEDFMTGQKYNLPIIMPVRQDGRFDESAGEYSGLDVREANQAIISKLKSNNILIYSEELSHSYPHCWRCKEPIIFRATKQWFLSIEHLGLRERLLKAITSDVKWVPSMGKERISTMVANRPDWCLSRQRYWGVPIIAFYCKDCNEVLLDADVIGHIADIFEKEGTDCWFVKDVADLLPKDTVCKKCGGREFIKETDIIDVWFDSGVSHQAVLKKRSELRFPCDLYLEGSDQHRGWFQSSLITSMGIDNLSPFLSVLTHGFVVDGEGRKMSKSLGNVVSPQDVMKEFGADILRIWVASSDYREDVKISRQILERLSDAYRKLRNTYRYILGNIYDFDCSKDYVRFESLLEIDRWALSASAKLLDEVTRYYEEYAFFKVFHSIYNFCVVQMSSFYLDILKDRLYIFGTKSLERRSAQTALFEILNLIVKMMAPLMPFTTEEVWQSLYNKEGFSSVHLSDWPRLERLRGFYDEALINKWDRLQQLRADVLKELERKREAGLIGSSLEAKVGLYITDESLKSICTGTAQLSQIFIVSQVYFQDIPPKDWVCGERTKAYIKVQKADGKKCQRCWNYSEYVGSDSIYPDLCKRCVEIVSDMVKCQHKG